jgi:hypothetical protein
MQPLASRRTVFAACILAIGGMAVTPADADTNDAGGDDAGIDAAPADASPGADATITPDSGSTVGTGADATAASSDGATAPADGASGDDGGLGPSSYPMDDGSLPTYNGADIFDRLCVDDPDPTTFNFSTVASPYAAGDTAACTAFVAGHTTARACLCQNCFTLQQQCDALPGCREIQKCGFDTGCTDADSCYLLDGTCVTPINNWGVGSVATALTQMLETCGQSNKCPTQ